MALINMQNISIAFGGPLLLDNQDFHIEEGQRIGLVGRNGTGKSTLLHLMNGDLKPDQGQIMRHQGLSCAYLPQDHINGIKGTIYEVAAQSLGVKGKILALQHGFSPKDNSLLEKRQDLVEKLNEDQGWKLHQHISSVITKLKLDPKAKFETLSGGFQRRALLARALAQDPDLLLLDEPTNHLDIESIIWLEKYLYQFSKTLVFITHDRVFLSKLATRIVELDRGHLMDWACDYPTFLKRKELSQQNEKACWERQDKKIAEEEIWLRKGLKARRTRNEGRVRALVEMRKQRAARRQRTGSVNMTAQSSSLSGKLVAVAEEMTFSYGNEKPVIKEFTTIILRGDKIGIMGPNGSGKTTLLRLLLGQLEAEKGTIARGSNINAAYFDQMRDTLDGNLTVAQNLNPDAETIIVNGHQRHVVSYLKDFLFTPDRINSPVRILSGGERNRLLLAKLFAQPSNLLILDEPTNDLDSETLELLEDLLVQYQGTILLVSHDRAFINNVVTNTLVIEDEGKVTEYAGGYDDWLEQKKDELSPVVKTQKKPKTRIKTPNVPKLNWKQERELEALPLQLDELEAEQSSLHEKLSDPEFYTQGKEAIGKANTRLEELEQTMEALLERWEELEAIKKKSLEAQTLLKKA